MGVLKVEQVELVLSPVPGTLPFGPDYTDESLKVDGEVLGRAARFFEKSSPSQADGTRTPDRGDGWVDETIQTALGFLRHTKDLRAVVRIAQAAMVQGGLEGLAEGLELLAAFTKVYWSGMHPAQGPDGGYAERIAILSSISGAFEDWEGLPLIAGSGAATLGGLMKNEETATAALERATSAKVLSSLVWVKRAQAALGDLTTLAKKKKPEGSNLIFSPETCRGEPNVEYSPGPLLRNAAEILTERLTASAAASAGGNGAGASAEAGRSQGASSASSGVSIKSREDVAAVIDAILRYYAERDRSSPIPNLLARCKRLSSASFDEIIADMLPEHASNSQSILGGPAPAPPVPAANGEAPAPADAQAAAAEAGGATPPPHDAPGLVVETREDVVSAIEALCTYYERNDISSPLPILLRRCQRLATKTFDEIIEDLLPGQGASVDRYRGVVPT